MGTALQLVEEWKRGLPEIETLVFGLDRLMIVAVSSGLLDSVVLVRAQGHVIVSPNHTAGQMSMGMMAGLQTEKAQPYQQPGR